ncbi:MAG: hypothetical protein A2017_06195 [Lentisphaerae bacterium GWF2_44_16]|nr:MAG: hypothetical protein A2017_06195 [Lentisphaerae bacterium GWF2_44_16]
MKKPNFILIMADQMRGDCVEADGTNNVIQTPGLNHLASNGARFNHAYSAVPSCLPARAILMTGQNQWHTGVLGMGKGQGHIPNDFPHTLAGELTKNGYRTHLVGKGHFHPYRTSMGFESSELDESSRLPDSEHRRWFAEHAPESVSPDDHGVGFNSWQARPWHTDERLHPTAWTMMRSLEFLKSRDTERPFFLNISFARPHSPYVPPEHYFNYYFNQETPAPFVGDWASVHDVPEDAANLNAWHGKMTPMQIHRARAGYYGEISFIDQQISRLIHLMARCDWETFENTWFIFTSDHGDMQGDHNLWRKTYAYEGSTRIPFIICPPKSSEGFKRRIADEVVELRDIMPTMLDAAGISIPETVDGKSLIPLMKGPADDWRKYIHGEHCACYSDTNEMHFVTDGRKKYVWFPRTGEKQFFNLETDPGECRNLINEKASQNEVAQWENYLVKELSDRNCGWVKDGKPFCSSDEPLVSPYKNIRRQSASQK